MLASSCLSVLPSVRPHETSRLQLDGFSWNCMFVEFFENPRRKLNFYGNNGYFTWRHIFLTYLSQLFTERNFLDRRCRENQNTHFVFNDFFFCLKSCRLWDNVEACCRAGQATGDNMEHVHCALDTSGYKHTQRTCNIHCFSTATMVALACLSVTLYVQCMSC
jgi:hypothetical protein